MSKVQSTSPKPKKPKLTDAERYKRFPDAANEVGASDDPKAFEAAFERSRCFNLFFPEATTGAKFLK